MSPSLHHLLDSFLDRLSDKVSMLMLIEFVSFIDGDLESRLVAKDFSLKCLIFGKEKVDGDHIAIQFKLLHVLQDVKHLLGLVLELKAQLQSGSPCLQKHQDIVPQIENIVLLGIYSVGVMKIICLQLHGHGQPELTPRKRRCWC